ncbi:sister chromatid cohesion protein Dcc1 [Vararia minispora EC-137]|uniref:Sister chromatid cohesion protein Dcc1 n=1 Tax=Vararia minispora EC-137 TaxID=1314806 RepID=A0ACB8Q981_9AGAM|nr:sister chromatid cohesion protein Dcc1 [Vararia minispora EC-137]
MPEISVKFPLSPMDPSSFRLLELPPDLCKLVEASLDGDLGYVASLYCSSLLTQERLSIKGSREEDAVLCTPDKTYAIRSVALSNSVLVLTSPPSKEAASTDMDIEDSSNHVVIQESLKEILELVPTVPKLHRLRTMLRGMEWEEGHEDEDDEFDAEGDKQPRRRRYTYEQARSELQASDREIDAAIKEKHILVINGALRPIAPSYLHTILELLLTSLVSLSQPHESASVVELATALESDHEIQREVSCQVMRWFGDITGEDDEERWRVDVSGVVKQIGLGVLRHYKDETIPETDFIQKWRNAVGDTFEAEVTMEMLAGNYLSSSPSLSSLAAEPKASQLLTYFPRAELPTDPALRFSDLFLTRARWKATDITPFLEDIAVDAKDRDRLLLKYARAVTDVDGPWYTARAR